MRRVIFAVLALSLATAALVDVATGAVRPAKAPTPRCAEAPHAVPLPPPSDPLRDPIGPRACRRGPLVRRPL